MCLIRGLHIVMVGVSLYQTRDAREQVSHQRVDDRRRPCILTIPEESLVYCWSLGKGIGYLMEGIGSMEGQRVEWVTTAQTLVETQQLKAVTLHSYSVRVWYFTSRIDGDGQ
ncbi:hypothetical protein EVAR_82068_1 [Eumeta japonica]|uniref:Uncharacterized protein n=1 Tax=Eumeta variegata TaxID=151549 RepID=A0A4C1U1G6_EUMVA|nr:hypothetical protein EVAR_82068_1 [Eumeta japonica]